MRANGPSPRARRVWAKVAALGILATCASAASAADANAARPLTTGFADGVYFDDDPATRGLWYDRTVSSNATTVLLVISWRGVTNGLPADESNPADPAYSNSSFARVDAAIRDATARGLEVILSVNNAPDFAEGQDEPPSSAPGTWKPDPAAVGRFGRALAGRYSGSFVPAGATSALPRVSLYQAWTEPNLSTHLAPQYGDGNAEVSPDHYRKMLNAFYEQVKSVAADNRVVTAGTAPYGDAPGGFRMRPLQFWRSVFCLSGAEGLPATNCPQKAAFDVFAHNAITTSGGPTRSAVHPDNAATVDFGEAVEVLRAAERQSTVVPAGRHPTWATEIWWESNPPDTARGVSPTQHARWTQQALYILWKQGADVVLNLQIRDEPYDPSHPEARLQSGLFFNDGEAKLSYQAFRFPFVTERDSRRKLIAWGKAPASGKLVIQRKANGKWKKVKSRRVSAGEVFKTKLKLRTPQKLRARVGGETSVTWKQ